MALTLWKKQRLEHVGWQRPEQLDLYPESYFLDELMMEKKRAQRGNRPLLLMLVDGRSVDATGSPEITEALCDSVASSVRDTDICGFLESQMMIAVIFTVIDSDKIEAAQRVVPAKIRQKLAAAAGEEIAEKLKVVFHLIPPSDTGDRLSELYLTPAPRQAAGAGESSSELHSDMDREQLGLRRLASLLQQCSRTAAKADL